MDNIAQARGAAEPGSPPDQLARRVLIVEANPGGHRYMYVRLLVQQARRAGLAPVLLLSNAPDGSEYEEFLSDLAPDVVRRAVVSLDAITQFSEAISAHRVIIPDGDGFILPVLRRRGWQGTGCLVLLQMRARATSRAPGRAQAVSVVKSGLRLIARRIKNVELYTLWPPSRARLRRWEVRDPVVLSDSTDPSELAANWHVSPDRRWIAVVGAITARKNPELVIDAAVASGLTDVGVLIAGRMEEDLHARLLDARERAAACGVEVIIARRLLTADELDAAIAVASTVVLAHSNEGPSGIMYKALALGTPVLAAGAVSLRRECRAFPFNAQWADLTVRSISTALPQVLALPRRPQTHLRGTAEFADRLLGVR